MEKTTTTSVKHSKNFFLLFVFIWSNKMNILPKKRWHVRTKDNIARVRRDEAEAAEQERKRIEKQEYAESEARLNLLRSKANSTINSDSSSNVTEKTPTGTITSSDGHVDLFSDFQSHIKTVNKEHEKEKKEEQEKYEKQIGYLTYLGQDTNEALKLRSWYEVAPNRATVGDKEIIEKDLKKKYIHDPLSLITKLLPPEKIVVKTVSSPLDKIRTEIIEKDEYKVKKSKKDKSHKKSKKKKSKKDDKHKRDRAQIEEEDKARKKELIDRLRKERLKREARERSRQEELLCPKVEKPKIVEGAKDAPKIVQKYNSQFNPQLAKQNMA
ncbi:leukocyte receptor cluster member 1 [Episyrphus balteatus]|uniref:leukocyte receptor cluster member 1 n=1 Tax=Episyrphus balteatus TaxID=286459 RepID=UPI002486452C|nr:leukocyte receptor cluster member 1 [Episyrphus balteatus]